MPDERRSSPARICVIRQGYFPRDPRVRREVRALLDAGHEVDVICVRGAGEAVFERHARLRILRLALPIRRAGPVQYVARYALFLAAAGLVTAFVGVGRRWHVVQVHTLPDVLVFAALGPRLLGARVVLDLHECMPEFLATKYRLGPRHPAVRMVEALEQAAIGFADRAVTCTEEMRAAFIARGADGDKLTVVLNAAEEDVFTPAVRQGGSQRHRGFRLISHGEIQERYGLDTLLRAVAALREEIPEISIEIFGDGPYRSELKRLAGELGLDGALWMSDGWEPIEKLVAAIAAADAGVVAMRRDAFRDLTHCNKMYDYIAMRRPAIVSRTRSVAAYFGESCFQMFEAGDVDDLARAIRELHRDSGLGARLVRRAAEVSEPYRWPRQREVYLAVVDDALHAR